ncbi:hypothetical protein [Flammeovirga sp. SubArs3]|uniref:hypothetical protein n=1 Tax=Flammeovirga sp. SubArs3 TaxID=2995316 RepID=UPI00248CCD4B|nr:hypothetical protein [Flammeovirga sp. SubArs3]
MYYDITFGIVSPNDDELTPVEIDRLLAQGYFRHNLNMASYEMMYFDDKMQGVLPLRCEVQSDMFSKSQRKKINQSLRKFQVEITPLNITEEHETLYSEYRKERFDEENKSLLQYFGVDDEEDLGLLPFETMQISFYQDNKLIAASYFDVGEQSIASLMAMYDHNFKQEGLGFISMLLEMKWALESKKDWYYPGYTLDQPSCFDYKLRLPNVQAFNWKKEWEDWKNIDLKLTKRYKTLHALEDIVEDINKTCLVKGHVAEEQNFFTSMWHDMFDFTQAVEAPIYGSFPIGQYHQMVVIYDPVQDQFVVKPHIFKMESGLTKEITTRDPEEISTLINAYFTYLQIIDVRITQAIDDFQEVLNNSNLEFDTVEVMGNASRHPNYKWLSLKNGNIHWMIMTFWDNDRRQFFYHPLTFKYHQKRWVSPFGLCTAEVALLKISSYIETKEEDWEDLLSETE